jgi:hypothetical protein
MIKYALVCEKDHEFESWFPGSDAFETQLKRGLVDCPFCGSIKVSKALMAPSVSTSRKQEAAQSDRRAAHMRRILDTLPAGQKAGAPSLASPFAATGSSQSPDSSGASVALLDAEQRKLRDSIRELHAKVTENTTDVGEQFADQARKMHDGDIPEKAIRGQASLEQAKELWEDGIPVLPLPALPGDKN